MFYSAFRIPQSLQDEIYCHMRTQPRTATPGPDSSATPSPTYVWWSMTSIILGGFISVLNNHVINVVIPKMMSGLGTDLDQRQQVRQALLAETQLLPAIGTQHALQTFEALASQVGGSLPPALHAKVLLSNYINREALLLAFNDGFAFFVVISLCGLVLSLFFRRARA
jgi:hypothetical protein